MWPASVPLRMEVGLVGLVGIFQTLPWPLLVEGAEAAVGTPRMAGRQNGLGWQGLVLVRIQENEQPRPVSGPSGKGRWRN